MVQGQTLEEVDQFKYLGSTQTKDGTSVKEVKIRLAQAHSAMTRLAILWKNKAISFPTKIILYRSLVLSVLFYGCESWMQQDAWHIIQRAQNERIRLSGASAVNRQASQVIVVRPCLSQWYAVEDHTTRLRGRKASQK